MKNKQTSNIKEAEAYRNLFVLEFRCMKDLYFSMCLFTLIKISRSTQYSTKFMSVVEKDGSSSILLIQWLSLKPIYKSIALY